MWLWQELFTSWGVFFPFSLSTTSNAVTNWPQTMVKSMMTEDDRELLRLLINVRSTDDVQEGKWMMLCSVKSAAFPYFRRAASHRLDPPPLPISCRFTISTFSLFHIWFTLTRISRADDFLPAKFLCLPKSESPLGAVASVVGGCGKGKLFPA